MTRGFPDKGCCGRSLLVEYGVLADVHADGLADGQLLADVAVDEALDNVFAVLDVDYYVVAEDHDGADRAGEVARAVDGNGDVLRTDGR